MTEVDDAAACMQRMSKQMALTTYIPGASGGVPVDDGAAAKASGKGPAA